MVSSIVLIWNKIQNSGPNVSQLKTTCILESWVFLEEEQEEEARVLTDRVSGYSNGFGFVRYATVEDAAEGIKGMDGKFLGGWVIFAEYARPRPQPSQFKNNAGSQPPGYGFPYGHQ
ncbi:hypothetical protein ACSBR2_028213 [Camellia fascicularis]